MCRIETSVWQFFAGLSVIMFIVAGILFATANGDPGKITMGKNAVIWGIVGILVAALSYSMVGFVTGWAVGP